MTPEVITMKYCLKCKRFVAYDPGYVTATTFKLSNWRTIRGFPNGVCPDCFEQYRTAYAPMDHYTSGYPRPEVDIPTVDYTYHFGGRPIRYGFHLGKGKK